MLSAAGEAGVSAEVPKQQHKKMATSLRANVAENTLKTFLSSSKKGTVILLNVYMHLLKI